MLKVQEIIIQSWSLSFEERGYYFIRDNGNQRHFTIYDIEMLEHFYNLMQEGMSQYIAITNTIEKFDNIKRFDAMNDIIHDSLTFQLETPNLLFDKIQHLTEQVEKLEEFNKRILEKLSQQTILLEKLSH